MHTCSICSGAFLLAQARLLDGRQCTTHWKVVQRLQDDFPAARVVDNRLFVRDVAARAYVPLTPEVHATIRSGARKL